MIQLEITQAIVLYSMTLLVLAVVIWAYTEYATRRTQRTLGKQYLWRCVFCGFSYLDESAEVLSQCPRCQSYNSVEDANARVVKVRLPDKAVEEEADATEARRNPSRRKRPHQKRRGPRRR